MTTGRINQVAIFPMQNDQNRASSIPSDCTDSTGPGAPVAIIVCETPNSTSVNLNRSKKMQVCLLFPLKHLLRDHAVTRTEEQPTGSPQMLCNAKPQVDQTSDPAQRLEQM